MRLEITSVDNKNQIMSLKHKKLDIRGVQFHPESIMTKYGDKMLENWVNKIKKGFQKTNILKQKL